MPSSYLRKQNDLIDPQYHNLNEEQIPDKVLIKGKEHSTFDKRNKNR